jgi:restriction endonuclease S subunit
MSRIINLPTGWKRKRLEKVAVIQTGIAKNKNSKRETIELPYLRVANVQDGYLDLSEIKTINIHKDKLNRYRLESGDVLLTEGGDFDKLEGTFQRLVEDPRTVNMESLYRVKENDLILNITFAWEGAIALVKKEDEECYVSHRFPTYEIKRSKAEPCFIRQLIMSSRMKYDLLNISPGGAGRNRVLNKKDFLKMPIWLPDLETQKNIGEYLGAIDKEIDLLKQLAEKYQTQKRGLMQMMLTGEWRVKSVIIDQFSGINEKQQMNNEKW